MSISIIHVSKLFSIFKVKIWLRSFAVEANSIRLGLGLRMKLTIFEVLLDVFTLAFFGNWAIYLVALCAIYKILISAYGA